jgi:hypothetical protein
MPKTVKGWEDIIENMHEFRKIRENRQCEAFKRFTHFSYWYYFPNKDVFVPNKFLGYKGTTLNNYEGEGDGGDAHRVLEKYFTKVNDDVEFEKLHDKLLKLAQELRTGLNKTVKMKGSIYIPKEQCR